jgi:hypothetical protein
MLAKAGIQGGHGGINKVKNWIPACAGMTDGGSVDFESTFLEPLA